MRGNNVHFSRATVLHELIPGHHLQGFMSERWSTQRRMFATPFYTEGWALYWEFVFWDRGFEQTPEDRIGALFWRMHRCARIRFSLGFHLGQLTPEQCVDMLVNEVGHERRGRGAPPFNGSYDRCTRSPTRSADAAARCTPRLRPGRARQRDSTTPCCRAGTCRSSSCARGS